MKSALPLSQTPVILSSDIWSIFVDDVFICMCSVCNQTLYVQRHQINQHGFI